MTLSVNDLDSVLETYSIEEILELNDLTISDALEFMLEEEFITHLPDPEPVDVDLERWETIRSLEQLDE